MEATLCVVGSVLSLMMPSISLPFLSAIGKKEGVQSLISGKIVWLLMYVLVVITIYTHLGDRCNVTAVRISL